MLRIFLYFIFVLTNILCYADYSDRGRPSDFQEHHDGPLAYLFMGVGVIIVLGLIGIWIYDKIRTHKEQISNTIGTMFAALLIFGVCLYLVSVERRYTIVLIQKRKMKNKLIQMLIHFPQHLHPQHQIIQSSNILRQYILQQFITELWNTMRIVIIAVDQVKLFVRAVMEREISRKLVAVVMGVGGIINLGVYIVVGKDIPKMMYLVLANTVVSRVMEQGTMKIIVSGVVGQDMKRKPVIYMLPMGELLIKSLVQYVMEVEKS